MSLSNMRVVSDGTLTTLDISFNYFELTEIEVYFDSVPQPPGGGAWMWGSSSNILFIEPVPAGVEVLLQRRTNAANVRHEFSKGSSFRADTLDENFQQILHITQEAIESNFSKDFFDNINMNGNRITGLAPGVAANDAATVSQLASATGVSNAIRTYATYAAASSAAPGLLNGLIVEVRADETRNGRRTRYMVQAGALMFSSFEGASDGLFDFNLNYVAGTIGQVLKGFVNVQAFPFLAKGDGSADDTAAIKWAISTGKSVFFPEPEVFYNITDEIGPKYPGQILFSYCRKRGFIRNVTNSNRLAVIGDPTRADGAAPQAGMRGMYLWGNPSTVGGIALPTSLTLGSTSWTDASKNCVIQDCGVDYVGSGWALEVYSWCNGISNFTGYVGNKRGAIYADSANQNNTTGIYLTGCEEQTIQVGGDVTGRRNRGNVFNGVVVQQSGGADGCFTIADADNTVINGLYSESNNSKGAPRVVYIKDTARGTVINGVSHLSGGSVVVLNEGLGTTVNSVVSSNITGNIVVNAGAGTINVGGLEWMPGVTPVGGKFADTSTGGRAKFLDNEYSGVWTPTALAVTNVEAVTAFECQFTRIGNVITFSGQVNIDPTATGLCEVTLSIPVPSNFNATRQAGGTYASNSGSVKDGGCIFADTVGKRLQLRHVASAVTNLSFYFTGSYLIR